MPFQYQFKIPYVWGNLSWVVAFSICSVHNFGLLLWRLLLHILRIFIFCIYHFLSKLCISFALPLLSFYFLLSLKAISIVYLPYIPSSFIFTSVIIFPFFIIPFWVLPSLVSLSLVTLFLNFPCFDLYSYFIAFACF